MLSDEDLRRPSLHFLSHYNSKEDIDALMDALKVFKYKICFVTLVPKENYLGISQGGFLYHLHRYCFFSFPFLYNYFPFFSCIINPSIIMIAVIKIT
jgi:hypothetical protein